MKLSAKRNMYRAIPTNTKPIPIKADVNCLPRATGCGLEFWADAYGLESTILGILIFSTNDHIHPVAASKVSKIKCRRPATWVQCFVRPSGSEGLPEYADTIRIESQLFRHPWEVCHYRIGMLIQQDTSRESQLRYMPKTIPQQSRILD